VLNTAFLTLILKLLKLNPLYASSNSRLTSSPASLNSTVSGNHVTQANTLSQQSRYLSASILALMLRYATIIHPPTIRTRDDHIVATLISLLKEMTSSSSSTSRHGSASSTASTTWEYKLKRRLVAAFGELVFYITAQENDASNHNNRLGTPSGDDNSSIGSASSEKWFLPTSTVELFAKCLKDDSDEVVKHYVSKTLENVFCQGNLLYRKKFINLEIASLLLDISQQSRNEILSSTSSMALCHLVFCIIHASFMEPSSSSSSSSSVVPAGTSSAKKASLSSTQQHQQQQQHDPFMFPSLQNSSRFILKIFEKCNFLTFLEILKDNNSNNIKLQQSSINLINMILIFPFNYYSISSLLSSASSSSSAGGTSSAGATIFPSSSLHLPCLEIIDYILMNNLNNPSSLNSSLLSSPPGKQKPQQQQQQSFLSSTIVIQDFSSIMNHQNVSSFSSYSNYLEDNIEKMNFSHYSTSHLISAYQMMSSLRNFFVKSNSTLFLSILFKLIEQSPINIIKAKALLSYQLLCLHNPFFLLQLGERRSTIAVITKVIEPLLETSENILLPFANSSVRDDGKSGTNSGSKKGNSGRKGEKGQKDANPSTIQSNYLLKNTLSFLLQLKQVIYRCLRNITALLTEMSVLPLESLSSVNGDGNANTPSRQLSGKSPVSPSNRGLKINASPSRKGQPFKNQVDLTGQTDRILPICRQLKQHSELLLCLLRIISLPSLCRLLIAGQEIFLLELTEAFTILPIVQMIVTSAATTFSNKNNGSSSMNEMVETMKIVEQACLASLECISQVIIVLSGFDSFF
jgi:hypothetical protein